MDKNNNYLSLKKFCFSLGVDLFGVADTLAIKDEFAISPSLRQQLNRAVSLGIRISSAVLEDIADTPTRLYFHHYRSLNALLDSTALRACNYIQKNSFTALPVPASQIVDWQNQQAHLSHKRIGYLAGLGWIGRNNLLVNKKLGSQFRLVSVLTDMPLKVDTPTQDGCGKCALCIQSCPCQAIQENPADFRHQVCFEKLKEFQRQKLVDQYICGICVKVCKGRKTR